MVRGLPGVLLLAVGPLGCAQMQHSATGPTRVFIELRAREALVVRQGRTEFFARGACTHPGVRRPVKAEAVSRLAQAALRLEPGPIGLRQARDADPSLSAMLLSILRSTERLGTVEELPPGPQSCYPLLRPRPQSTRPPGEPRLNTALSATKTSTSARRQILGSLTKNEIATPIRTNLPEFKQCYEAKLSEHPRAAGGVNLQFVIAPDGSVTSTEVIEDTVLPEVGVCVESRMKQLRFPKPRGGGIVVVTYPFTFAVK